MGLYRARVVIIYFSATVIVAGTVLGLLLPAGALSSFFALLPLIGIVGMLAGYLVTLIAARRLPPRSPVTVTSPVVGRWLGVNSPVAKVPSHGVRAYGQAYAIDLIYDPVDQTRPVFGSGPALRRPQEYPAFGQPVHAMVDGVVVKASDGQRDHRARSTWLSVVYMMIEGSIRELCGPSFVIGNRITIRTADGVYALVAHLKQGSVLVEEGDTVVAGQVVAACGNTGNSSEPHVHAQLMDRASAWTGQGIPCVFSRVRIGDEEDVRDGLPGNEQLVTVAPRAPE